MSSVNDNHPCCPRTRQCRLELPSLRTERGVALAIVVWFIAGMSLLVAGIVSQAAVDTRLAQLHVARAKVSAAGDGAVQLMLAELVAGKLAGSAQTGRPARPYRVGELEAEVSLVPTSGLINLNAASPQLLAALFSVAAGADESTAQLMADNVVNWRAGAVQGSIKEKASARFREVEDLLRVDGIGRTQLDAVRNYVVAGSAARGGTDWLQASRPVLAVLEKMDPGKHAAFAQRKERKVQAAAGQPSPAGGLRAGGDVDATGAAYRADVVVRYADRTWLRRSWVTMEAGRSSLLPWRIVRIEAPRVIAD